MDLLLNLMQLMAEFLEMHLRSVIDFFEMDRHFLLNLTVFKFSDDT